MDKPVDLGQAHLRIARLSPDLSRVVVAYHLAFVHKPGHPIVAGAPHDNLLVFYLPDTEEWKRAVARLEGLGRGAVTAFNPYWDKNGKTFEDPDGYRVVLQHASWSA